MFRRISLSLLLLVASVSAFPAKRLMIELTNGTKVYYNFANYRPYIRFVDGTMRVTTRKFEFSQIAQFAVVDDPSSIDAVEASPQLSADGMVLTVMSMEPIQVFSMQGVAQQVAITTTDEAQLVNLATLPTGSYVIRCGEQSFTLYKK
ncbi:MAG: T9SS type A sorting domain-containing protein [Bacteroidaceae bacterium]|nr:T9SS type A sorting domain-containing protein [Bacteroidaceae bacterium]